MHINEETLKNITIRKTKRNFRLSFNTETVSPTFVEEIYPRIGDTADDNGTPPVINDYDELNSILQRESEERSVFSQNAELGACQDEKLQASPPKLRKLRNRNKKNLQPISEENLIVKSDTYTKTASTNQDHSKKHPYNVSDEPSPTASHETIEFPSSPERPSRGSTSDSEETFFDPMETIEKESTKNNVETDQAKEIPDQDDARTCNITYRTKRKPIPDDESPNLLPPMQNRMYAKSMADIFTDSTLAEHSRKSDDSRAKLNNQVEPWLSLKDSQETLDRRKINCDKCAHTLSDIQAKSVSKNKNNSSKTKRHICEKHSKMKGNNLSSNTIKRNYFLRSKLGEFIDSMVANDHHTSVSKLTTEPTNDKDSGCEDSSSDWGKKARDKQKTVKEKESGVSKRTCDKRNQLENFSEVQCLGTTTIEDDTPSEWSRIGIRKQKPVPATPSKTPLISTTSKTPAPSKTPLKSHTETPLKNPTKTSLKLPSKTPHKTPSKTALGNDKKLIDASNTQTIPSESPSHTNPVVFLDRISTSSLNLVHKNQSVQTQSSKSTFETKPVKHLKSTNRAKSPASFYKTNKARKDESVYCKSCQQKTPKHQKNFGSYEIEDDDDDDDFVSNEVSNLSGVGQLEARNENYGQEKKPDRGVGKLMKDVVAFVDVKLDGSDKSRGVIQMLNHLGAQISKSLHKNVTHVIFYEGALSTVEKATQWRIPIVSVKWVNACKASRLLLCTEAFPPVHIEDYMDSIRQSKDELFKTVLRTVAKDLGEIIASDACHDEIEVPLSILILRKYVTPHEADSEHSYNLASIELSLGLDRPRRALLRRLAWPHRRPSADSSDDWTLSPVVLPPRCSAPGRLCSRGPPGKTRASKEAQYGGEVERIRSILGTQKKDAERKICARTEVKRNRGSKGEANTQSRQDFHDALNRLRGPAKTPNKKLAPPNIEPGPSRPKAVTPHLLAAKKRIHFRRSSLPNRAKDSPPAMPRDGGERGARAMPETPHSSPSEEMCVKAVQSVDWRTGSDLKSSSEVPAAPGRRLIRQRRLYEDASLDEPLQSARKNTAKRKPQPDLHKGKALPFDKLMREQKYSNIYDAGRSEKEEADSSRSSSYWFVSQSEAATDKPRTRDLNRDKPGIVCTGIHSKDIKSLYSTITQLGHFVIEPRVTARTTHVVVDGPKRTLNLLKGIARGCWIVKRDWVLASFHVGRWLYEQRFELSSFSPAVQRCRMERQTFGPLFAFDILSKVGRIFVSRTSRPPRPDLQELITLCGGRVAPTMREADLVLGGTRAAGREHVAETWLLDCVTRCSQLAFDRYRLS